MKFYVGMRGQEHKRAIAGPSVREVANVIELRIIPIKLLRKPGGEVSKRPELNRQ